ncbi:MAG: hypothetical protein V5A34_04340 [Halapricum sp.]
MTQPTSEGSGLEGEVVRYRGATTGSEHFGEPDTEIVVTDRRLHARPMPEAEGAGALEFSVPLAELQKVRCDGVLRRTVTIGTAGADYEIPTNKLDERRFRSAMLEQADLSNSSTRFEFDVFGICPCEAGTCAGCLLVVMGVGLILSLFGALLGVAFVAAGIVLLALVYASRAVSNWRGANVWQRVNGVRRPN